MLEWSICRQSPTDACWSRVPLSQLYLVRCRPTLLVLLTRNYECLIRLSLLLLQCSQLMPGQSSWRWFLRISFCSEYYLGSAASSGICSKGYVRTAGRCIWRGQPKGSKQIFPIPSPSCKGHCRWLGISTINWESFVHFYLSWLNRALQAPCGSFTCVEYLSLRQLCGDSALPQSLAKQVAMLVELRSRPSTWYMLTCERAAFGSCHSLATLVLNHTLGS